MGQVRRAEHAYRLRKYRWCSGVWAALFAFIVFVQNEYDLVVFAIMSTSYGLVALIRHWKLKVLNFYYNTTGEGNPTAAFFHLQNNKVV